MTTPEYTGPERRTIDTSAMEARLLAHLDERIDTLEERISKRIAAAYPSGDEHAHRVYHEGVMRSVDASRRIREDLALWIVKGGLTVLVLFLLAGMVEYLRRAVA